MTMNRRTLLKRSALVGAALATSRALPVVSAQSKFQPVKIGDVAQLKTEFATLPFTFDDKSALVTRLPKPEKQSERVLEVKHKNVFLYFAAYNLVCTHAGCNVAKPSAEFSADKQLACPCHGSRFAPDGAVIGGPAREALRAIKLKLEGDVLYAVDYATSK
jgi:cytochrome b6-f complex iron-sulfur subunit